MLNICGLQVDHYFMLFLFIHLIVLCDTYFMFSLGIDFENAVYSFSAPCSLSLAREALIVCENLFLSVMLSNVCESTENVFLLHCRSQL